MKTTPLKCARVLSVILMASVSILSAAQTEFHVAPSGSDKNPGTKAKPFKTIAYARDQVAKINGKKKGDIVVHLGGGTYEISESVVFDANDSGTNGHKVIYKAAAGQTPIVSGGKAIKNWQLHDKEKNIYKASVGDLEFRQIYVNGVGGVRARHPNRTSEVTLEGYLLGGAVTGKPPFQFQVTPAELTGWETWSNLNEVEVVMVTHWKQKRARIASIAGNLISFLEPENTASAMNHLEQAGTPHWYENAYEFLDAEGEFYLNTKTDTLYYKLRAEEKAPIEVIVPVVETLFDIRGSSPDEKVHDLLFEGITFQYSNWTKPNKHGYTVMQSATWYSKPGNYFDTEAPLPAAIQLANASKVEIRSCTVRRTGATAISAIKDVVSDCSIVGNLISYTATGGIYLLLNDEKSTGNKIIDNTIEYIGMCYSDGCGILVAKTPDVDILHNEIRHVRYTGITTGWSWDDKDTAAKNHDVGYNLIHHTMGLHDDGGGVYTLGKIPGMKVHHNYFHNILRSQFSGNYGICSVYLDNGSCFKLVQDNVTEKMDAGFFASNRPNHSNTFDRNYYSGKLIHFVEKENAVTNNIEVKGSNWPPEAVKIMKEAGPRGAYRRPEPPAPIPPRNLAANMSATASSSYAGTSAIGGNDSLTSTIWASAAGDAAPYWQVDLGKEYYITKVELVARQDSSQQDSARNNFEIRGSTDSSGSGYTVLGSQGATAFAAGGTWTTDISVKTASRYIRVAKTDGMHFNFSELRVYELSTTNTLPLPTPGQAR